MTVTKEQDGNCLTIFLAGALDTETAPALEKELKSGLLEGLTRLTFDFAGVTYVSSFGLRVLLYAHTTLARQRGQMTLRNVSPAVLDVFDVTGFSQFLDVE